MINKNIELLKEKEYNLITVLGPTAVGKTRFAALLANELESEIISADSRQIYKLMDIGTGKDIEDYFVDGKKVPYYLIDIIDAGEKYNLFEYRKDFFDVFEKILKSKKNIPIMCGGTGLYLESIIKNYELAEVPQNNELRSELEGKSLKELEKILSSLKKLHNTTEIDTPQRAVRAIEIELFKQKNKPVGFDFPKIKSINIGIKLDREKQKHKITKRLNERLENGMIQEVQNLLDSGVSSEVLIYYGLEYKFITLFLLNKMPFDEMKEKLNIAIHQFSKRQMTWFRKMERQGIKIYWIDAEKSFEEKYSQFEEIIKKAE